MFSNYQDYAPFFRNGLLYLPPKTVNLLIEAGLEKSAAESALRGLALDDDRALIGQISTVLEQIMAQVAEDSRFYQELSSDQARFMLTGYATP